VLGLVVEAADVVVMTVVSDVAENKKIGTVENISPFFS